MKRTIIIECQACGGTGLYKGIAERDGAAVVCSHCHGTGKTEFTYNEFEGRKEMDGVTRVFEGSFGYVHTDKDTTTEEGRTLHFSQYGCSYEEWKAGVEPTPMEELYCPYIYRNRGIGNEPCSRCKTGCKGWGGSISDCKFYSDKAKCWEEWHKNND